MVEFQNGPHGLDAAGSFQDKNLSNPALEKASWLERRLPAKSASLPERTQTQGIAASSPFLSVPPVESLVKTGTILDGLLQPGSGGLPPLSGFTGGDWRQVAYSDVWGQPRQDESQGAEEGSRPFRRFQQRGGPLRDRIRNRLQELRENPQAIQDIINRLGNLSKDVKFNVDAQNKTISLGMDFTRLYDFAVKQNPAAAKPELQKLAAGLDSFTLGPDALVLNWKNEQVLELGDKGPAKGYKLSLGGGNKRTQFNINTTASKITLSDIQGVEAVEPGGRRLKVHEITLDTSDKDKPKGTLTIDNPLERPKLLPAKVPWPEKVSLPIMLSQAEQKPLVESLPGVIKTIDTLRNAAKTGDLKQLLNIQPQDLLKLFGWTDHVKDKVDFKAQPEGLPPAPDSGKKQETPPNPAVKPDSSNPSQKQEAGRDKFPFAPPGLQGKTLRPGGLTGTLLDSLRNKMQDDLRNIRSGQQHPGGNTGGDNKKQTPPVKSEKPSEPKGVPDLGNVDYLHILPGKPEVTPKPEDGRSSKNDRGRGNDTETRSKPLNDPIALLETLAGSKDSPLTRELKAHLGQEDVKRKLGELAQTINRFDVDKTHRSLIVGLDFARAYDAFAGDKKTPEARKLLGALDNVEVSPDSLKLKWRANGQVLPIVDDRGNKKADIIFGAENGTTSFDVDSSQSSLTLKNIQGLQAEVKLLGKRLAVHQIKIDASDPNKPVGTIEIDTPFEKPGSVPESAWQRTMTLPLELKTGDVKKDAEIADRLPKLIRAINNARQRGGSPEVLELLGRLKIDDLKTMFKAGK